MTDLKNILHEVIEDINDDENDINLKNNPNVNVHKKPIQLTEIEKRSKSNIRNEEHDNHPSAWPCSPRPRNMLLERHDRKSLFSKTQHGRHNLQLVGTSPQKKPNNWKSGVHDKN